MLFARWISCKAVLRRRGLQKRLKHLLGTHLTWASLVSQQQLKQKRLVPSHHLNFELVLGGQPSFVICKLLVVRQKSTRRNSLGIWDVLVAPRVLEVEYFYAMVRHEAFHDVKVVVPRLLLLLLLVLLMLLLLLMLPSLM